jgi:hypothetical protein
MIRLLLLGRSQASKNIGIMVLRNGSQCSGVRSPGRSPGGGLQRGQRGEQFDDPFIMLPERR